MAPLLANASTVQHNNKLIVVDIRIQGYSPQCHLIPNNWWFITPQQKHALYLEVSRWHLGEQGGFPLDFPWFFGAHQGHKFVIFHQVVEIPQICWWSDDGNDPLGMIFWDAHLANVGTSQHVNLKEHECSDKISTLLLSIILVGL